MSAPSDTLNMGWQHSCVEGCVCVCVCMRMRAQASLGKAKDCFHRIGAVLKYKGDSFSQVGRVYSG